MEHIQLNTRLLPPQEQIKTSDKQSIQNPAESFFDFFKGKLSDVNELMKKSEELDLKLAAGEAESIHEVMIAAQKAQTALNMTMSIRSLLLRTFQDLLRMR